MKKQIKYLLILLIIGTIFSQGNFQILNIPSSTRLLALSNAGQTMDDLSNSANPAAISFNNKNINFHSHIYPAGIIYAKSGITIPLGKYICSFEYANLNYGEFKDGNSDYSFNSSEFLFKNSIKTHILNKISIGGSLSYAINKISNQFSHAILISLGLRTQMNNPHLGFGISINNIGKIVKNFDDLEEPVPTYINLSTFYKPKHFPGVLFVDICQYKNIDDSKISMGVEFNINDYLLIRLGNSSYALDLQDSHSSYLAGLSGGLGIKAGNWNIDLGFYNLETAGIVSGISLLYKK